MNFLKYFFRFYNIMYKNHITLTKTKKQIPKKIVASTLSRRGRIDHRSQWYLMIGRVIDKGARNGHRGRAFQPAPAPNEDTYLLDTVLRKID